MPGLAGIIYKGERSNEAKSVSAMIQPMRHEAFYSTGCVSFTAGVRAELAWTCHPDSFSDCMPVWNETKDICLVFTGEEFSAAEQSSRLRSNGHSFDAENASYLVHLYEEAGEDFVKSLDGWFSGVVVDLRKQKVLLFNDRYGLNRVYFHETESAVYFSSEAKSILKVLSSREIDTQSLGEFFACGCTLEDRTLFRGISLMPGASKWVFENGGTARKERYFSPEGLENLSRLTPEHFIEEMCATFSRILPRYFRGPAIGLSLTGGLDSRLIMAWAAELLSRARCYTFGGMYRESRDVQVGRQVAQRCGSSHEVISVDSGFMKEFPSLAQKTVFISDGTMDVTGAVELYINRKARGFAPIRLSGSYGGEIMRGIVAFKPSTAGTEFLSPDMDRAIRQASETYARIALERKLSFIAFRQVPWHHYARYSIEQSQLTVRSPFLANGLVSLAYRVPEAWESEPTVALQMIAKGNSALDGLETDRCATSDRSDVVTRVRKLWQEFTFKAEYAYDYGMPQWLARIDHALSPLHPERFILGRHKFYHFRPWYRDAFGEFIKGILLDRRALKRSFIAGSVMESAVNAHVSGTANSTLPIHRALTCELAIRTLCESN
jgi:asparagine synthase (glutamine-hydrolysing)